MQRLRGEGHLQAIRCPGTAVTPLTSTKTRVIWGEARAMTQMQATAAEPSAPDAGQLIAAESSGAGSSSLPTQVISFAIGDDRVLDIVSFETNQIQPVPRVANGSRVGFLSGLVTTESGMIAVIDLANLLSIQIDDDADARPAMSA